MKVAIATSAHEVARPFLADWSRAVLSATGSRLDVEIIVAIDDLRAPEEAFSWLAEHLRVTIVHAPRDATVAEVRGCMISASAVNGADAIVFCDADDTLLPEALHRHEAALTRAAVSVGDMLIGDSRGRPTGTSLFASRGSEFIKRDDLLTSNPCGFSNTAVRRDLLQGMAIDIPAKLVAVDWWLFSVLLDEVGRAAVTDGPVAIYRQHKDNMLGAGTAHDLAEAERRLAIAAQHYAARPGSPQVVARRAAIKRLQSNPALLREICVHSQPTTGWFSDVAGWIVQMNKMDNMPETQ